MTATTFALTTRTESDFTRFEFTHAGGLARDARIHLGFLADSVARAGDRLDLGDRQSDILAVAYNFEHLDSSTITADYPIGVASDAHFAVFLTWWSDDSESLLAIGAEADFSTKDGFSVRRAFDAAEARAFLLETQMIVPDDVRARPSETDESVNHFTTLTVEGYRGFAQEKTLHFAQPTGEPGSGLTLLVGPNNSGKSTFIEAIQVSASARTRVELNFPQPRRHRDLDAVTIGLERIDGRRLTVRSVRAGGSQATASWSPGSPGPDRFDIHVTPARRSFTPYFGNSSVANRDWGLMDQEFSRTQSRDSFVGRLRKVDRDNGDRFKFDTILEEIVGEPLDWTFDEIATSQQFIKLTAPDGAWHTSEGLGDGLVSLLFIVDALYDSEPGSLIAIDEPELSLHPQLVRRLRAVLSRFAADRQIVVATHSPLLIDWSDIRNGAAVARVFKAEGKSEVAQASASILSATARLAGDRNLFQPHTVDVVAREAFFREDGIILTEGQDDVIYLPRVLEDLGLGNADNVYGWGSGGATNIPILARLFIELGFRRIAAILDDDGRPETEAALAQLEAMAPEVLVRSIPAPDIRYKKQVLAKPEVIGLLQEDATHVRDDVRDQATTVIREILEHVQRPHAPNGSGHAR